MNQLTPSTDHANQRGGAFSLALREAPFYENKDKGNLYVLYVQYGNYENSIYSSAHLVPFQSGSGQSSTNSLNSQTASSEWKRFINWPESPQDENDINEVNSIEVSTTKDKKRKGERKRAEYSKSDRRKQYLKSRNDPIKWEKELKRKKLSHSIKKAQREYLLRYGNKEDQEDFIRKNKEKYREAYKKYKADAQGKSRLKRWRPTGEALEKKRAHDRERMRKKRAEQKIQSDIANNKPIR